MGVGSRGLHQGQVELLAGQLLLLWGCAESENLSLAEQLVVEAGLYKDIAFLKYKKAIGKLTFLFYQFSSFYISPPHARPPNRCFQISESGSGYRGSLANSGLHLPPAQGECQILMENYFSSDPLPSCLNGGRPLLHWWILPPHPLALLCSVLRAPAC